MQLNPPPQLISALSCVVVSRLRGAAPSVVARKSIEPAAIEPAAMEPAAMEPAAIEPAAIEPAAIEPTAVDPRLPETARPKTVFVEASTPVVLPPLSVRASAQLAYRSVGSSSVRFVGGRGSWSSGAFPSKRAPSGTPRQSDWKKGTCRNGSASSRCQGVSVAVGCCAS